MAARELRPDEVRYGADGLVAAVVQDSADGRVLMVGWQDAEALEATLSTGEVHFHSRSRDRLWRKGETSGNTLRLLSAQLDCDADAILLTVDPYGPTCHTGARSCFDVEPDADATASETDAGSTDTVAGSAESPPLAPTQGFAWLETLWAAVEERARTRPAGSYTATLLDGGVDAVARKVAEEATEVLMAAKDDAVSSTKATREALSGELADLLYHALVLCAERGVPPSAVVDVLRERHAR